MTSVNQTDSFFKARIEIIAVRVFGAIFRILPRSSLKVLTKINVFDRYLGWRKIDLISRTRFGATVGVAFPDTIQTTIFLTGIWEPSITEIISEALGVGDVFVDIGANVGYYSLLGAHRVGPNGRVYAFEASPSIFEKLTANIARNKLQNVVISNNAVSNARGRCEIFAAQDSNIGHSTIVPEVAKADGHRLEAIIDCDALQRLMPEDTLLKARFIKIDIEGAEFFAVDGLRDLLPRFSADTEWLIEFSPSFSPNGQTDIDWMFDVFTAQGYRAFLVENQYSDEFLYAGRHQTKIVPIFKAPTFPLCDVLFSKRRR